MRIKKILSGALLTAMLVNLFPTGFAADADGSFTEDVVVTEKYSIGDVVVNEEQEYIVGDVNGDGVADVNDAKALMSYLNGDAAEYFNTTAADVNFDNQVNISDYAMMCEYFGISSDGEDTGPDGEVTESETTIDLVIYEQDGVTVYDGRDCVMGDKFLIELQTKPDDAVKGQYSWNMSDSSSVATLMVNDDTNSAVIIFNGSLNSDYAEVYISIEGIDSDYMAMCRFNVVSGEATEEFVPIQEIRIYETNVNGELISVGGRDAYVGENISYYVEITPDNATTKDLLWRVTENTDDGLTVDSNCAELSVTDTNFAMLNITARPVHECLFVECYYINADGEYVCGDIITYKVQSVEESSPITYRFAIDGVHYEDVVSSNGISENNLPHYEVPGRSFRGWYDNVEMTGEPIIFPYTSSEDITLHGRYVCVVAYTGAIDTAVDVDCGSSVVLPTPPDGKEYVFTADGISWDGTRIMSSVTVNVEERDISSEGGDSESVPVTEIMLRSIAPNGTSIDYAEECTFVLNEYVPAAKALLEAVITPVNAANKEIIWTSDNTDVAEILTSDEEIDLYFAENNMTRDESKIYAVIYAKAGGLATITATSAENKRISASCYANVMVEEAPEEQIRYAFIAPDRMAYEDYGSYIDTPWEHVIEGADFIAWYDNADYAGEPVSFPYTNTTGAEIFFYGKYVCNITYTGVVNKTVAVLYGDNTVLPAAPENTEYIFTVDGNAWDGTNITSHVTVDVQTKSTGEEKPLPDENAPKISISEVKTRPGQIIEVSVDLSNNTGFAALGIEVGYDESVMTLTNAAGNSSIGATFTPAQYYTANPYNMSWDSASNVVYNGNLATLTFQVNENAPDGIYPITLDYYKGVNGDYIDGDSINYDENFEAVGFVYVSGNVVVASYMPGDINGDEIINNKDATFLLRYLAGWSVDYVDEALDVNGDGEVNNKDATVLLRYLAGWDVTLN